ncbi:MAG: CoA transferase, partial [Chloroflexota bacterium]|nr:CoA transferase [Chloroflexota bacterium]
DYGATVVRIESLQRPDFLRTSAPFKDRKPGVNRCGYFAFFNANKYSITLDLKHSKGIEVVKRFIAWADILLENFRPGVMEARGLSYDEVRKINPGIIMVRSSGMGHTGPYAKVATAGIWLTALGGLTNITGWPDRGVAQPYGVLPDFITPVLTTPVMLAALDHKRKTGEGECIDISQFETTIQFIAPLMLDFLVNNNQGGRRGNEHSYACPHGAYCCKGQDRWCAIAVFNDEEWKAFGDVLDNPRWLNDAKFATLYGRKEHEDELNKLVEEWTVNFSAEEVMTLLQSAGVAAGVIKDPRDIYFDPQLRQREHFWPIQHEELDYFYHLGQASKLSQTPAKHWRPAPCLGEHTEYVCTKILGMADTEFIELDQSGAFFSGRS